MKKILSLILLSLLLINNITVKASDKLEPTRDNNGLSSNNIYEQNTKERIYMIEEIIKDALRKETIATNIFYNCFEENCASNYSIFATDNNLEYGSIIYKSIELAKSEKDNYIMANIKTQYKEQFNLIYLFKFRVNSDGKIDEYKIYQY